MCLGRGVRVRTSSDYRNVSTMELGLGYPQVYSRGYRVLEPRRTSTSWFIQVEIRVSCVRCRLFGARWSPCHIPLPTQCGFPVLTWTETSWTCSCSVSAGERQTKERERERAREGWKSSLPFLLSCGCMTVCVCWVVVCLIFFS